MSLENQAMQSCGINGKCFYHINDRKIVSGMDNIKDIIIHMERIWRYINYKTKGAIMNNPYKISAALLSEIGNQGREKATDAFHSVALYGNSVRREIEESACRVFQLENETGTGEISVYQVFPGIELVYNDIHMTYCNQSQTGLKNTIEINHCREGRYECSFGENSCCYMAEGDLTIGSVMRKKSSSNFPLSHYHGITITISLGELEEGVCRIMELLDIDLQKIKQYIVDGNRCCIMRANPSVEHIFSELYFVREQRKSGYMKIKILEMLLFLSDLDTRQEVIQTEYYSQKQVSLIKEIADFITKDITKHYTIEQLAEKYNISPTALKKCFRGVYGSSVYAYLRMYRLQTAARLLEETALPITEIAAKTGYDNPNKLSSAFKQIYGVSPTDFRKGVRLGRDWSKWSGEEV